MVFGGVAYAFWSSTGSGGASGTTGDTAPVILSPGTATAQLRPGGRADVVLDISNSNPSPVDVGSLLLDTAQGFGGYGVDAAHTSCTLTSLDFTTQANGGAGWTVPARNNAVDGTIAVTLTGAVFLGLDAANDCQGARITVLLKAGP